MRHLIRITLKWLFFFWNITKSTHQLGFCPQTLVCDMQVAPVYYIEGIFEANLRHFWSKNSQSSGKSSPIIPLNKIQVVVSGATEEVKEA